MLEGLDDIDWASLGHAYGSAEDVPEILRALASNKTEERQEAIYELFGNICHQGTVYEATAPTVPFLIDLAGSPEVEDGGEILWLLASIAGGSSYLDVHQHLDGMPTEQWKPDFEERLSTELLWVENARAAVARGIPAFEGCLADDEPKVRAIASYLLASLATGKSSSMEAVRRQWDVETDPWARASLVWAGYRLSVDEFGPEGLLTVVRMTSEPVPVRLLAVICLLWSGDEDRVRQALPEIPKLLSITDLSEQLPWFDAESVVEELSGWLRPYPALRRDCLLGLLNDPLAEVRLQAVDAIGEYCRERRAGPQEVVLALVERLGDNNGNVRKAIVKVLPQLGEAAKSALGPLAGLKSHPKPAVQKAASDTELAILTRENQHTLERWQALHPPRGVTNGPLAKVRVPGLIKTLLGEDAAPDPRRFDVRPGAASTLGAMGPLASTSIPALTTMLDWPDQWVRVRCAIALWKISGDAEAVLPTLIAELRGRPVGILAAACLADMGPAAAPARETLERIVNSETRLVELGIAEDWIDMDEAIQSQCRRALESISGPA